MFHSTKYSLVGRLWRLGVFTTAGVLMLACPRMGAAATFNCTSGNTTCLIAAINSANSNTEADTITLAPGLYTLAAINNTNEVPDVNPPVAANGLPVITSAITIIGAGATSTILERH